MEKGHNVVPLDDPPPVAPNMAPVFAAIKVALGVLNTRLLLLFALIGAIWLSKLTIDDPNPWKLGTEFLYLAFGFLPLVWLTRIRG